LKGEPETPGVQLDLEADGFVTRFAERAAWRQAVLPSSS
jgi:hypothetical protein